MPEIVSSASGPGVAVPSESSSSEFEGSSESSTSSESQHARPVPASQRGDSPGDTSQPGQQKTNEPKRESRYERTKRQRAEFQKREMALKQREAQLAQIERERNQPKKPNYTLEELRQYRNEWESEGRTELVEKADAEIKRLEGLEQQQTQSQAFQNEWHQAEAELAQADPEFGANKGTRLDKKLRELMDGPDGNIYRQHPRGIVAAYHRARMEILESDHAVAQKRISELETELKRLTGLTSIGGGSPGRVTNGNQVDFSRLSTADMRKRLRSTADKSGSSPWF
jgi:hypothetical protein